MVRDESIHTDQSIIELVDGLIALAVDKQASDIHLEPRKDDLRVRLRLDGVLHDHDPIAQTHMHQVISRVKVLGRINIAEKRLAQDGKFSMSFKEGNPIDFRISTFPTLFGEKIVIRILDRAAHMIDLETLGFAPLVLSQLRELLQQPHGFFLVTGPTGSGKTTTLYAMLAALNSAEKNILTLEDPVEYNLDGVTQGQINLDAGFDFQHGMRSLLRQDPDVLMVGEIRDRQSAQIAIEAALTGHLVLSTLHTNDAPSAYMRLMEMGIEPFLINASLTGVLAQRLVRTVCSTCTHVQAMQPDQQLFAKRVGVDVQKPLYKGKGCTACDGTGYKGRTGLFEFLRTTPLLRERISKQHHYETIYEQALADGMQTLLQDGAQKVAAGTISLAELARVMGN